MPFVRAVPGAGRKRRSSSRRKRGQRAGGSGQRPCTCEGTGVGGESSAHHRLEDYLSAPRSQVLPREGPWILCASRALAADKAARRAPPHAGKTYMPIHCVLDLLEGAPTCRGALAMDTNPASEGWTSVYLQGASGVWGKRPQSCKLQWI